MNKSSIPKINKDQNPNNLRDNFNLCLLMVNRLVNITQCEALMTNKIQQYDLNQFDKNISG